MDMIPLFGGLVPTLAEVDALEALLDQDEQQISGLVEVAELIAQAYLDAGEKVPESVAAELAAVRRTGGVSAAVRRAGVRTGRRAERKRLRTLTGAVAEGVRARDMQPSPMSAQVTGGRAAA